MKTLQTITRVTLATLAIAATFPVMAQQKSTTKPAATKTTASKPVASTAKPATSTAKPQATVAKANPQPAEKTEAAKPAKTETANSQPAATASSSNKSSGSAFSSSSSRSQAKPSLASSRNKYLNAGFGIGAWYGGGFPLGASFEVDVKDNISVGASVDYYRYGYRSGGYRWNYNFIYAGARGSYHLGELLNLGNDKFDPYAGATIGFRHASYHDNYGYNDDYYSPYSSGLFLGVHAGARYMFSPKIGGFAEVGYGVSALRLGITAKF